MSKTYAIANSSALVAFLGVLSPLAGIGLEMALASTFGGAGLVDAYRSSYLLIGFGSTLFASFFLPHLVVPAIARYREAGREEEAWRLALSCGAMVTVFAVAVAAWVWIQPDLFSRLLAPGLRGDAQSDMRPLLRATAFGFVVTLWSGVMAGILQIYRSFTLPASTQVVCNLSLFCCVLLFGRSAGAVAIVWGIAIGFGAMALAYTYSLARLARRLRLTAAAVLRPAAWQDLAALLPTALPLLTIVAATIAGSVAVNRTLSRLGPGVVAQYGYSIKPLLVLVFIPSALSTVLFPSLAEAHARTDGQAFIKLTARAIKMILLSTATVASALFCLREPLLRLLFGRGAMDPAALARIAVFFSILLAQAPLACVNSLLLKISFARGDALSPAILTGTQNLVYLFLFGAVAARFGSVGAMVAITVVNGVFPLFYLAYQIRAHRVIQPGELASFAWRLALVCAGIFAVLLPFSGTLAAPLSLVFGFASMAAVTTLLSRLLGIAESREIENYAWWLAKRLTRGFRRAPQTGNPGSRG